MRVLTFGPKGRNEVVGGKINKVQARVVNRGLDRFSDPRMDTLSTVI